MTLEEQLRQIVREEVRNAISEKLPSPASDGVEPNSWRERLWTCPAETRLGLEELSEALGRPSSAIYKLTSAGEIPYRKCSGSLVFIAGEIREWVRSNEEIQVPGEGERRRLLELAD